MGSPKQEWNLFQNDNIKLYVKDSDIVHTNNVNHIYCK